MSEMIAWINAQADNTLTPLPDAIPVAKTNSGPSIGDLPAHSFSTRESQQPRRVSGITAETTAEVPQQPVAETRYDWREEKRRRASYRGRTVSMLRRYMRYSMETGRLPSLLGREFFRSKVPRHTAVTFEDRVIFVHDMETCLHRLDEFSQKVIGRIVLQEYSHEEAADLLGCTRMTVHRTLVEGLDRLSSILLRVGLMERLHWRSEKSCQEGSFDVLRVSGCKYGE